MTSYRGLSGDRRPAREGECFMEYQQRSRTKHDRSASRRSIPLNQLLSIKLPTIPLLHLLNLPIPAHHQIHHRIKLPLPPRRFLTRQIFHKSPHVLRPDAMFRSPVPEVFDRPGFQYRCLKVRVRGAPEIEVVFQPGGAAADEAEGVIGVGCRRSVDGCPDFRVGLGPGGDPGLGWGGCWRW